MANANVNTTPETVPFLYVAAEVLNQLEQSLYDLETARDTAAETLASDLDPEHKEFALQCINEKMGEFVNASLQIMQDAGLLSSHRNSILNPSNEKKGGE